MLIVPGISFYRRARRSWSNKKLRRLFHLLKLTTVDPWRKLLVVYYLVRLLNLWMLACLHMFFVLHAFLFSIRVVTWLLQGSTSVQCYESSLDLCVHMQKKYYCRIIR
jgi:hypothetical protein